MKRYSQKENVSHGSKTNSVKDINEFIKFVIQKSSKEMPVAKAVISLKIFAVNKKHGVPEFSREVSQV